MPTLPVTISVARLRLLVLGALIAGALLFTAGSGTARAYTGVFCNKYLYPRGNAYDHCLSNYVTSIKTATNQGDGEYTEAWVGIYTTSEGWHGNRCYFGSCVAQAQSSYRGNGYGENANMSSFGDGFNGYLYAY